MALDSMFTDKILLITGGTGSFGNAVLERLLLTDIREIRIFSRDEKKQDDMRGKYRNKKLKFFVGDVRDPTSIGQAISGADYVFHAAALKQVPSCEFFPIEAVKTNVLGTENVLTAAVAAGVKKVVCLSTDKAAYPINAMGISKAMMEKIMIAKSRFVSPDKTVICGVRYGNVMASRGSVIPLFTELIQAGKPLTLTNPNMTRFLMSLEEAVDLVLYSFRHAESGDLVIQKSPASTIADLAQALLELFQASNPIEIIGARHGEKNHEVLLTREEAAKAVDLGGFYKIPADNRDLVYSSPLQPAAATSAPVSEYSSNNTRLLSVDEVKEKLLDLPFIKSELHKWNGGGST